MHLYFFFTSTTSLVIVIIIVIITGNPLCCTLPLTHLLTIHSLKYSCFDLLLLLFLLLAVLIHQDEYPTMGNHFRTKEKEVRTDLSDANRVVLITDQIEELSDKQCFYTLNKLEKYSCLSTLEGDGDAMDAIASYIFFWAKLDPLQQKVMLIEKINRIPVISVLEVSATVFFTSKIHALNT
jgi:hypothetical protein